MRDPMPGDSRQRQRGPPRLLRCVCVVVQDTRAPVNYAQAVPCPASRPMSRWGGRGRGGESGQRATHYAAPWFGFRWGPFTLSLFGSEHLDPRAGTVTGVWILQGAKEEQPVPQSSHSGPRWTRQKRSVGPTGRLWFAIVLCQIFDAFILPFGWS